MIEVLDLTVEHYSLGTLTVREYLIGLLKELWDQKEGFSGKRPYGDSGWECDLYIPLIKAGLIHGHVDDEGYLAEVDDDEGDRVIAAAIGRL